MHVCGRSALPNLLLRPPVTGNPDQDGECVRVRVRAYVCVHVRVLSTGSEVVRWFGVWFMYAIRCTVTVYGNGVR